MTAKENREGVAVKGEGIEIYRYCSSDDFKEVLLYIKKSLYKKKKKDSTFQTDFQLFQKENFGI